MRPVKAAGFTLIEVVFSLVLLALFATSVVAVVHAAGQSAARSAAGLLADRTLITARLMAQQELRDAQDSDVTVLGPARLALTRGIGEAITCGDSAGVVAVPDSTWAGTRMPQGARDDAWLLIDPVLERWLRLPIDSVAAGTCPISHASAIRLFVAAHPDSAVVVRVVEPVEWSAYRSGATDWFGLTPASHSAAVQPFAGPLVPGAARFAWFADHLDVTVPLFGGSPVSLLIPLGLP